MTPTERIATALLGWSLYKCQDSEWNPGLRWYALPHHETDTYIVGIEPVSGARRGGDVRSPWPDLETLDGCRQFEDALVDRGLLRAYWRTLPEGNTPEQRALADAEHLWVREVVNLRATPEQRRTACLKVLDEAGL